MAEQKPIHVESKTPDLTGPALADLINAGAKIAQEKLDIMSEHFGDNVTLSAMPELDEDEIRYYVQVKVTF